MASAVVHLRLRQEGKHNENFGETSQLSSRLIYRNWISANEQFPVGRISLKHIFLYVRKLGPAENYFRCDETGWRKSHKGE